MQQGNETAAAAVNVCIHSSPHTRWFHVVAAYSFDIVLRDDVWAFLRQL
jgi:hypothetical protein